MIIVKLDQALIISPGNMKFCGVLLFTPLENFGRAMACDGVRSRKVSSINI